MTSELRILGSVDLENIAGLSSPFLSEVVSKCRENHYYLSNFGRLGELSHDEIKETGGRARTPNCKSLELITLNPHILFIPVCLISKLTSASGDVTEEKNVYQKTATQTV